MSLRALVLLPLALLAAGCASITETTEQTILVRMEPEYATCVAQRGGEVIGSVSGTNPRLTVNKSRFPMFLSCSAPGFSDQTLFVTSSASRAGVAGIYTTAVLAATDFATGAFHKYPDTLSVTLLPVDPRMAYARAAPVRLLRVDY